MKFHNRHLDTLANGHSKILVFDCEFWHVLGTKDDKKMKYPPDKNFYFLPREIGGFTLTKQTDGSWKYKEPFFVAFKPPKKDIAFPISHFSTVTPQTGYKLDFLEKQLGLGWGESYPSKLSDIGKKAHDEGIQLYLNDANIKQHIKPSSWYKTFMKSYSDSIIVVKGTYDIEALENASHVYDFKYNEPKDINDIAEWNIESSKKCGSAKLEKTYLCIERELDDETAKLAEILPLEKAHDPSTDASMTLLVALYIISKQP